MILREHTEKLMNEELKRANEEFPMFSSNHEGVSVIEEELFEAREDFESAWDAIADLKVGVYKDRSTEEIMGAARQITCIALFAAAEMIQVAAMGQKFRDSMEYRVEHMFDEPSEEAKKKEPIFTDEEAKKFDIEAPEFLQEYLKKHQGNKVIMEVPKDTIPVIFDALLKQEDNKDE